MSSVSTEWQGGRMRCLVAGMDEAGRSAVRNEREIAFGELMPGLSVDALFRTTESPPAARPEGRGELVDLGLQPGQSSWALWRFEAGSEVGMHHTDTVDFNVVLEGAIELILDDGAHALQSGDCVVMTGVDHAWRAGPTGCLLSGVALGSRPRD